MIPGVGWVGLLFPSMGRLVGRLFGWLTCWLFYAIKVAANTARAIDILIVPGNDTEWLNRVITAAMQNNHDYEDMMRNAVNCGIVFFYWVGLAGSAFPGLEVSSLPNPGLMPFYGRCSFPSSLFWFLVSCELSLGPACPIYLTLSPSFLGWLTGLMVEFLSFLPFASPGFVGHLVPYIGAFLVSFLFQLNIPWFLPFSLDCLVDLSPSSWQSACPSAVGYNVPLDVGLLTFYRFQPRLVVISVAAGIFFVWFGFIQAQYEFCCHLFLRVGYSCRTLTLTLTQCLHRALTLLSFYDLRGTGLFDVSVTAPGSPRATVLRLLASGPRYIHHQEALPWVLPFLFLVRWFGIMVHNSRGQFYVFPYPWIRFPF